MNKKEHKKKAKRKISKEVIIRDILFIAFLVVIIVVAMYNKKISSEIYEDHEFYQYDLLGERIEYSGKLNISREKEITKLEFNGQSTTLDSTPMYYKDEENKLLITKDVAIIYPTIQGSSTKMYKINTFSNIYLNDEIVFIEKSGNKKSLENAFIFDGNNLYLFIDNTTLNVNGQTYELSPLSYVKCQNNGKVEIYNKKVDEYIILEEVTGQVTATSGEYKINLSQDSMEYGDTQQLLLKRITDLDPLMSI